ncbi:MAG: MoaD/ThiS family protein [Firmicutes bacterium]|nr:MoaD/ThiS family protein [Bacillota bacterium]
MEITLQLKGPLKKYADETELFRLELDGNELTVTELLQRFEVPASSVSFVQVNGIKIELDHPIKGGDKITVNPRVAGG